MRPIRILCLALATLLFAGSGRASADGLTPAQVVAFTQKEYAKTLDEIAERVAKRLDTTPQTVRTYLSTWAARETYERIAVPVRLEDRAFFDTAKESRVFVPSIRARETSARVRRLLAEAREREGDLGARSPERNSQKIIVDRLAWLEGEIGRVLEARIAAFSGELLAGRRVRSLHDLRDGAERLEADLQLDTPERKRAVDLDRTNFLLVWKRWWHAGDLQRRIDEYSAMHVSISALLPPADGKADGAYVFAVVRILRQTSQPVGPILGIRAENERRRKDGVADRLEEPTLEIKHDDALMARVYDRAQWAAARKKIAKEDRFEWVFAEDNGQGVIQRVIATFDVVREGLTKEQAWEALRKTLPQLEARGPHHIHVASAYQGPANLFRRRMYMPQERKISK